MGTSPRYPPGCIPWGGTPWGGDHIFFSLKAMQNRNFKMRFQNSKITQREKHIFLSAKKLCTIVTQILKSHREKKYVFSLYVILEFQNHMIKVTIVHSLLREQKYSLIWTPQAS